MTPTDTASDAQTGNGSTAGTAITILGIGLISLLLVSVVVAFVMTLYQFPRLNRFRDAELLIQLFANLVVASYAFPAFKRTGKRAFLALGFAALIFAYGAVISCAGVGSTLARFAIRDAVVLHHASCFRHCRLGALYVRNCINGAVSQGFPCNLGLTNR